MFCPKCGTQLPDGSIACSSCGTSFAAGAPRAGAAAAVAGERMKAASSDALGAFKTFMGNPVGGLADAYNSLGPARALGVGITFGAVFAVCTILAVYRVMPFRPEGAGGFLRILLFAVVPFVALMVSALAVRTIFRGEGAVGSDSFLAGAALLPFGFLLIIASLLGVRNFEVTYYLSVFAVCLTILMLFAGITRIYKVSERGATLAIPIMLVATAWLSRVLYGMILNHGGGYGGGADMFQGFGN